MSAMQVATLSRCSARFARYLSAVVGRVAHPVCAITLVCSLLSACSASAPPWSPIACNEAKAALEEAVFPGGLLQPTPRGFCIRGCPWLRTYRGASGSCFRHELFMVCSHEELDALDDPVCAEFTLAPIHSEDGVMYAGRRVRSHSR
jgi:hypothetical protein